MWHRNYVVAGSFYPSNEKQLKYDIDEYIANALCEKIDAEILGLISPHAGYVYSGPIAGYSFSQLRGKELDFVVVLAPSHRARFNGASVIPSGSYATPLGNVEIDGIIGESLIKEAHFSFIEEVHSSEHSLEVQVPFLQRVLKEFKLVPVIIGVNDINSCRAIADELYKKLENEKRKFVIIISTDLSHYYPYEKAKAIDSNYIEGLKAMDEVKLDVVISSNKAEACGHGPVLTGMILCKKFGAKKINILHYANSGDTAGSKSEVVGYLAAAIWK